jgi:nucleoid DNA-binding protein
MTAEVLSKELSKKLGIDADIIEKVIRSEFKLIRDTMKESDWEGVKLQYLGKFVVKENKKKYARQDELHKRQRIHTEGETSLSSTINGERDLVERTV